MIVELAMVPKINLELLGTISPNAFLPAGSSIQAEVRAFGSLIGKDRAIDLYMLTFIIQDSHENIMDFLTDTLAADITYTSIKTRAARQSAFLLTGSLANWQDFCKNYPSEYTEKITSILYFNKLTEARLW